MGYNNTISKEKGKWGAKVAEKSEK